MALPGICHFGIAANVVVIVIYLISLYYRKLLCCNRHLSLSISVSTALMLICRIASKLDHMAARLERAITPSSAQMTSANNVISRAYG